MAGTSHFSPELFVFLRQLKRHNNREWFARNKVRFDNIARDPALAFITEFAPLLHKISPAFIADARASRGSLFRIYRDTRFANDKTPYKTHLAMHFSHLAPKKSAGIEPKRAGAREGAVHWPGFYLHIEPQNCYAAAGLWHADTRALQKVRTAIVGDRRAWKAARRNLNMEGDRLSR